MTGTTVKISIAMATYNGGRFIDEQLQSFSAQTLLPHELVVTDDGSTDSTIEIVERFAASAPFPVRLQRNEKKLGYANNFFKAARLCEGEWVAFSDQDDVWLPHRISDCAEVIGSEHGLNLVLQNARVCDAGLQRTGRLFPNTIRPGVYGANLLPGFWMWPGFGCTARARMFQELSTSDRPRNFYRPRNLQGHDKWVCMVGNALGGVAVTTRPAALYRRHSAAVTAHRSKSVLSPKLTLAFSVGANHYAFLSDVAHSSADYLERSAKRGPAEWEKRLLESAANFRRFGRILALRERVYRPGSRIAKLRALAEVVRVGAYTGDPFLNLNVGSFGKDLLHCLMPGFWQENC